MIALYEAIRTRNPQGLPYEDAVQLYLWIFCTTMYLPDALKSEPIGKEQLTEVFEALTRDGLIHPPRTTGQETVRKSGVGIEWSGLVRAFLLKKFRLDQDFPKKFHRYI
jgi:hypothetical protein